MTRCSQTSLKSDSERIGNAGGEPLRNASRLRAKGRAKLTPSDWIAGGVFDSDASGSGFLISRALCHVS